MHLKTIYKQYRNRVKTKKLFSLKNDFYKNLFDTIESLSHKDGVITKSDILEFCNIDLDNDGETSTKPLYRTKIHTISRFTHNPIVIYKYSTLIDTKHIWEPYIIVNNETGKKEIATEEKLTGNTNREWLTNFSEELEDKEITFDEFQIKMSSSYLKKVKYNFRMKYVNKKQDDIINAIFIQSFHKEIITGVLQNFLINLTKLSINIPIVLFLDLKSKQNIQKLDKYIQNISIVYVNDQEYANSVTTIFYKLMNYKILEFPKILLLESDCLVKQNFLNILNSDIKDKDFWIYGSFYYGLANVNNRKHMNGVAIYNRNNNFLNKIKHLFIKQNYINKKNNYDSILSNYCDKDKLIDSDYILNICHKLDINLDYSKIKKKAVVIHQKHDLSIKYNRKEWKYLKLK